jgi:hypothetical protein
MPLPRIGRRFCGVGGYLGEIVSLRRQIRQAIFLRAPNRGAKRLSALEGPRPAEEVQDYARSAKCRLTEIGDSIGNFTSTSSSPQRMSCSHHR